MVKNDVLGRIRRSEGYGSIRLGPENRLAGSAEFLPPDFQKSKFYPPPTTYIVISILLTPMMQTPILVQLDARSNSDADQEGSLSSVVAGRSISQSAGRPLGWAYSWDITLTSGC